MRVDEVFPARRVTAGNWTSSRGRVHRVRPADAHGHIYVLTYKRVYVNTSLRHLVQVGIQRLDQAVLVGLARHKPGRIGHQPLCVLVAVAFPLHDFNGLSDDGAGFGRGHGFG